MIHPSAIISPQAQIGAGVSVGPYSIVHDNVVIGAGAVVTHHVPDGVIVRSAASEQTKLATIN